MTDYFDKFNHLSEALQESFDHENYLIGTFAIVLPARIDPWFIGRIGAEEQTTGTWVPVPENTPEVRAKYGGKVIGVYEIPSYEYELPKNVEERHYIMQIAFPTTVITPQIPMMLTSLIGNISMGGKIKLLDIKFPDSWLKHFKGPKFGIEGLRKLLKVPDRPLINNMIKPNTGWSVEVGARLFYEVAMGGVDIVKDDELMADAPYNRVLDRVPKFMEMADKKRDETGEETLYTVNITDTIDRMKELAYGVQDAGGNALMANYLVVGLPAFRMLAEDPEIKLPILAHMDMAGVYYEDPFTGISSMLTLGKLARLSGADIVVFPAPYGKAPFLKGNYINVARAHRYRFGHLKPTMPMPSGGMTPGMVPDVIRDLGNDVMIGVGGGIHAHPDGPRAGGKTFRQAIDVSMKYLDEIDDFEDWVEDHEDEYPELAQALSTWGTRSTKFA
ncbi:MAG: RuBisCO large subunit C-terminal-like domain-containing protein [Candidatus Hodarchaeales archaeon]|jgi:2,3-diketo-5-methylthiopentyl-1-phosphate enolase